MLSGPSTPHSGLRFGYVYCSVSTIPGPSRGGVMVPAAWASTTARTHRMLRSLDTRTCLDEASVMDRRSVATNHVDSDGNDREVSIDGLRTTAA